MKKLILLLTILTATALTGCEEQTQLPKNERFVSIYEQRQVYDLAGDQIGNDVRILLDKETGVRYLILDPHGDSAITPLITETK